MTAKNFAELLLLSAIWGASFLFMRISAPEMGALPVAFLRIIIAALTLAPLLYLVARKYLPGVADKKRLLLHLTAVGIGNSIIPFIFFSYAAINIDAGLSSIINATTPLWGALFGFVILNTRLNRLGWLGLFTGFIGVFVLSSHKLSGDMDSALLSILAVVAATCMYGLSANYSKRFLVGVPPMMVAAGTMATSAVLVSPALFVMDLPFATISNTAWLAQIALGAVCTGIAYVIFYRLIEHTGPTKAMTVTYLIPIFGVLFGYVFLQEALHLNMLFGGVLILFGVMLTTGLFNKQK